ncbi:predicted protein [Sclerotinia sclerotiorum 1980 UF-70]|uniref:Uncharacterized protein n=1 Tax=Sclerotinia sclerotiorum (strain ATCC 18683 / 1980 / Ss-1) TaxID=665079 RepID=A7F0J9_SCLS1|nr:predicted protein [Sclerotinia sclerotiorum 1980 UF-70]EDN95241.1 predicted protein [Sclerotinia sclerotiorum 1980 UF-70]
MEEKRRAIRQKTSDLSSISLNYKTIHNVLTICLTSLATIDGIILGVMEGRNQNKGAVTSRFGPNPDEPLMSIEGRDTGSSDDASAPMPPAREWSQQRGGLIGSRHHRTSSTTHIPTQLAREQRGSGSGYSASLSLGSRNPRGQQQLSSGPVPDALNPNDNSNYPTQLPPNLRQRAQMQLGLSAARGMVLPAESLASKGTAIGSSITTQSPFGVLVPDPVSSSQQLKATRASRGVTFSLAKNASVRLNPFRKVVPATVKLVADNGQLWKYKYPGARRDSKSELSGNVTIARLNDWANSILRRRLPDNFPAAAREGSSSTPPKPKADKWTEWERAYLEAHIMDAVKAKKTKLDEEDWQLIADAQSEEFFHHKRLPGLPLAHLTSCTLTIDNVPVIRAGGFTKIEGYFPKRSSSEIQSILYHWPDIQEKIKEEIRKNHGKTPEYLDCGTDLSDSETTSDDENGENDTNMVDSDASELVNEGPNNPDSPLNEE